MLICLGCLFFRQCGVGCFNYFCERKKDVEVLLHAPQSQVHRLLARLGSSVEGYFELTGLTGGLAKNLPCFLSIS